MTDRQAREDPETGLDEESLHRAIRRAHAAGAVEIAVNFRAANRSGAPGFRTTDIVVPPFCILVLSGYLFLSAGAFAGGATLLAGTGFFLFILRPWTRQRTEERTRDLALARLEDWNVLWRLGGLALRLGRDPTVTCVAPAGDWRAFVRDRLLPGEPAGHGERA